MQIRYLLGLAVVAMPLASFGDTIFSDTFANGSTLNAAPTGGFPTATATDYENWSQGVGPTGDTIASGDLHFTARNTSSVFTELQANFPAHTLSTVGDFVNLSLTFTDTANILLAADNTSAQIDIGLYNSGGTRTLAGNRLDVGTAGQTGGANGYVGYIGRTFLNGNSGFITRPAQSGAGNNSTDQDLLFNNAGSGAFLNPTGAVIGGNTANNLTGGLLNGQQYTIDLKITLATATSETISESMYNGNSDTGTPIFTQTQTASGPTLLATTIDTFAIGWRHTGTGLASSMDINSLLITDQDTPEPSTLAISGLGAIGLLIARRWKARK